MTIVGTADRWRRTIEDARAVFERLDADVTRHLEQTWRGHAGRQALEALRRYIRGPRRARPVPVADGRADRAVGCGHGRAQRRRRDARAIAPSRRVAPAMPVLQSPASTVPAGFGAGGDGWSTTAPSSPALHRNGFDDHRLPATTHTSSTPSPRAFDTPLPAAGLNAATMPATPPGAATPPSASAQPSVAAPPPAGLPYQSLMGRAFPGVGGHSNGAGRRTPDYLITLDNGNQLIRPLPKVTPPVIGD